MSNPPKVSLQGIAERAGVHRATVSLALRNHPRIPAATCRRIQALAREMGYAPNAAVVELMTRVRRHEAAAAPTATLGWLNAYASERAWRTTPYMRGYLAGARARAAERGYGLDELWLKADGMTARRMDGVLRARGIRGVLVPSPPERYGRIGLDWSQYAAVAIDHALFKPELDRVVVDYLGNAELALRKLWRGGCRRIGLWLGRYQDIVTRHLMTSGYLGWQARLPAKAARLAPMLVDLTHEASSRLFAAWVREQRPDGVVCIDGVVARYAQEAGLRVPGDLVLAHLNLHEGCGVQTGVVQRHEELGAVAVDLLIGNLLQGRFGEPAIRRETAIAGLWREG